MNNFKSLIIKYLIFFGLNKFINYNNLFIHLLFNYSFIHLIAKKCGRKKFKKAGIKFMTSIILSARSRLRSLATQSYKLVTKDT